MVNCKGSGIRDTEDKEDKGNITPLTLPISPSPIILAY